jgi:glutaredoxin
MAKHIVVYHQPGCPPCHRAIELLTAQKIPFVAKDVAADPKAAQELSALGSNSTPTIVIDGQTMVGFNPQRLLQLARG